MDKKNYNTTFRCVSDVKLFFKEDQDSVTYSVMTLLVEHPQLVITPVVLAVQEKKGRKTHDWKVAANPIKLLI